MSETPWSDEYYHDDDNFDFLSREKRARGRYRQTRTYAAVLAKNPGRGLKVLASKLRSCAAHNRCGSGACPQCMTAQKRHFIGSISTIFETSDLALLTIIPTAHNLQRRNLGQMDLEAHRQTLNEIWEKAGLSAIPFLAGFDLSWDVYTGCAPAEFWCGHWHGFIDCRYRETVTERLGHFIPPTLLVPKPVYAKPITKTPERAYSYGFKTLFDARLQKIHDSRKREMLEKAKITPNHPKFPMLALNLDRIGLSSRIIKLGVSDDM